MRSISTSSLLLLAMLLTTGGCSKLGLSLPEPDKDYGTWSAERFYDEAQNALRQRDYSKAIDLFERLEARYPFGRFAAQAQLEIAYANYKYNEPDAALAACDRFIQLHPRHPKVDYAYYLKGLVNYNKGIGFLERFMPTDSSQRDPGATLDSYRNFEELATKYPDSIYTPDARQRMIALRNNLAMLEIHVARYYIKRGAYVAAAARGIHVIESYQRTPAVPLALDVMYQAYTRMGMTDLAADAKRVFDANYPNGYENPETMAENQTLVERIFNYFKLDQ